MRWLPDPVIPIDPSDGGAPAEMIESSPSRTARLQAVGLEPDPVIEAYKRDIDRTLLRRNLRRAVAERVANLIALQRLAMEARPTGRKYDSNE